jgi:hypothetical protein
LLDDLFSILTVAESIDGTSAKDTNSPR